MSTYNDEQLSDVLASLVSLQMWSEYLSSVVHYSPIIKTSHAPRRSIRCRSSKSRIPSTLIPIFIFCRSGLKSLFCIIYVNFGSTRPTSTRRQANWELIICALIHLVTIPTIQFIGISTVRACIVKIWRRSRWRAQHRSRTVSGKWFVSPSRIGLRWRRNSRAPSHAKKVPYTKPSTKTFCHRFRFCSKQRRQSIGEGESNWCQMLCD